MRVDDLQMTDGHTLVIPAYNRPALLRQLLRYYRERALRLLLLILDSSQLEIVEEHARTLAGQDEMVRHAIFPGAVAVVSKLAQGLAQVQTPYASFCADDDLVFPGALRAAVAFLKGHPEYVCAHGLYLNFREADHDVHLSIEYGGAGIEARHPAARVFRLCQEYESLFYAAFRTEDLREVFSALPALSTVHFQELFQSVATVIKGKVGRLPVLYAARRSGPPAEPGREKWQTGLPRTRARSLSITVPTAGSFGGSTSCMLPRLEKDVFFRTLDLAHAVYFAAGCPPEFFHSVLQPYWPQDSYIRIGHLDALAEARRLLTLRRILWPAAVEGTDMLEHLRTPPGCPGGSVQGWSADQETFGRQLAPACAWPVLTTRYEETAAPPGNAVCR